METQNAFVRPDEDGRFAVTSATQNLDGVQARIISL